MDELTAVVIEMSVGSAVKVKLTVAFEKGVVRRYRAEADYNCQKGLERRNEWNTSKTKKHLRHNVACLWYRSIGIDYGRSGYSVGRYLPKG